MKFIRNYSGILPVTLLQWNTISVTRAFTIDWDPTGHKKKVLQVQEVFISMWA